MNHSSSELKTTVSLELVQSVTAAATTTTTTCKVVQHNDNDNSTSVRIVVELAVNCRIDAEQANLIAALLFEKLDSLVLPVIQSITIHGLCFLTQPGREGIQMIIMEHCHTIRNVTLHNLPNKDDLMFLTETFFTYCSQLQQLDLSYNSHYCLEASLWRTNNSNNHVQLQSLKLIHVTMDDASMIQLNNVLDASTLEELHLSLLQPLEAEGLAAAEAILNKCLHNKLTSLQWTYRHGTARAHLPWQALQALGMSPDGARSTLTHLVLGGSRLASWELDVLVNLVAKLGNLKTLQLRNMTLNDTAIQRIVKALQQARPPLICLDLSYNSIDTEGVQAILELCHPNKVLQNLSKLTLTHNKIQATDFVQIVERFTAICGNDLEIRLEHNAFDAYQVALDSIRTRVTLEQALSAKEALHVPDQLAAAEEQQHQQRRLAAELLAVQHENEELKHEREIMVRAFSIMGVTHQVEESQQLLQRIARLEALVLRGDHVVLGREAPSPPVRRHSMSPATVTTVPSPAVMSFLPSRQAHESPVKRAPPFFANSPRSHATMPRNRSFDGSLDLSCDPVVSTTMAPSSPAKRGVRRTLSGGRVSNGANKTRPTPPLTVLPSRFHCSTSASDHSLDLVVEEERGSLHSSSTLSERKIE